MPASGLCLLVLFAFASPGPLLAQQQPSYGELAEQLTYPQYNTSVSLLPTLTNTSQPGDSSIHKLRKGLILIRDYLDIFVYAFPNTTNSSNALDAADFEVGDVESSKPVSDVWKTLRDDFNVGYTVIGDFQDLNASKVNYTHKEYETRLNKCLAWKATFLVDEAKYAYDTYVQRPATDRIYARPDSELSQFYWEYAGIVPELDISGLGNIARLESGLLNLTSANYSRVYNLTHVYTSSGQVIFHDYRKLLRSVTTVFGEFAVVRSADCTSNAEGVLSQAYTLFGNLHDVITAYDYYKQKGNKAEEKILAAKIDAGWQSLQTFMTQNNLLGQIECLLDNLIPFT